VLLAGCGKENVSPAPVAALPVTISDVNWQLVRYTYEARPKDGGPTTIINYFDGLGCPKDDVYSFRVDNKLVLDQNVLLCTNNEAKTSVWSTWALANNGTQLVLSRGGANYLPVQRGASSFTPAFDIVKLTADELVLSNSVTRAADSVITVTYGFGKY
jgi:hypothetical protein